MIPKAILGSAKIPFLLLLFVSMNLASKISEKILQVKFLLKYLQDCTLRM